MPKVQLLYIKKSNEGPGIPTEEVMRIFETEKDLEKIKSSVEQAKDRLYVSWASVDVADKAHERIPIEEVAAKQDILLERGGPITDEHSNKVIGTTLGYKLMQHPTGGLGVLHLNKIYDHNMLDDKVWSEIKSGERTGSSVGGFNEEESYEMDDKSGLPIRVLLGFNHMETASVHEPCNPLALNEAVSVVAKSRKNIGEKHMINVKKKRVYLRQGQKAPEGVSVQQGRGGGTYYETEGSSNPKRDAYNEQAQMAEDENKPVQGDEGSEEGNYPEPNTPSGGDKTGRSSLVDSDDLMNFDQMMEDADNGAWGMVAENVSNVDTAVSDAFVEEYTNNYTDKEKVADLEREIGLEVNWDAVNADNGDVPPDPEMDQEVDEQNQKELDSQTEEELQSEPSGLDDNEVRAPGEQEADDEVEQLRNDLFDAARRGQRDEFMQIQERLEGLLPNKSPLKKESDGQNPKETQKHASVINKKTKEVHKHTIKTTNKGDMNMDEEAKKAFAEVTKKLDAIEKKVAKMDEEEKKPKEDEEEVKKEVNESGKEIPEDQRPEEENQEDVFKAENEALKNKVAELEKKLAPVSKSETKRPEEPKKEDVKKTMKVDPVALAKGEVKKNWNELTLDARDIMKEAQ